MAVELATLKSVKCPRVRVSQVSHTPGPARIVVEQASENGNTGPNPGFQREKRDWGQKRDEHGQGA